MREPEVERGWDWTERGSGGEGGKEGEGRIGGSQPGGGQVKWRGGEGGG